MGSSSLARPGFFTAPRYAWSLSRSASSGQALSLAEGMRHRPIYLSGLGVPLAFATAGQGVHHRTSLYRGVRGLQGAIQKKASHTMVWDA